MRRSRKPIWICLGIAAAYIVSYALNSASGGYWGRPEMDGHDRYSFGLAMPTAVLWQPRWGHYAGVRSDLLGLAYSPLISLDRRLVHPTIYLSAPDGFDRAGRLERGQVHPSFRGMYDQYHTNSQQTD